MSTNDKFFTFDPPKGPIRYKYLAFRDGEDFAEEAMIGPVNTAKSTAALDSMIRRAYEYPGSNILIVRATLQNLKGSTLLKLEERYGAMFIEGINGASMNRQEGIYRFPYDTHPYTMKQVQSTIRSMGVDRNAIDDILRSTEFSYVFFEEAGEIASNVIDELQIRCRQQIFHRTKKVKHLCFKLASQWEITPEDVFRILSGDERHRVGQLGLSWEDPMPGSTVLKMVWNPDEDNAVWQRMVGVPYPDPYPTEDWVKNNIGIREVHIKNQELQTRRYKFVSGTIVKMPDGSRRYSAGHDAKAGMVKLVPKADLPIEIKDTEVGLIVQRNTIFVHSYENESRDYNNDTNSFLVVNKAISDRAFLGASEKRKGRVFTNYVDDYVENGGNLIKDPGREKLASTGWITLGGIDMGGNHSHAIVTALLSPQTQTLIFYGELCKAGLAAAQIAHEAKALVLPGASMVLWGHDPSMAKRVFDTSIDHRYIDTYREILIDNYRQGDFLIPAIRGDVAFDYVNELMMKQESLINVHAPKILVLDTCDYIRSAMRELTWKMVDHERSDFKVDVGDAVKYCVSMRKQQMVDLNGKSQYNIDEMFKPNLVYT